MEGLKIYIEDNFYLRNYVMMIFGEKDGEIEVLRISEETYIDSKCKTRSSIPESCKIYIERNQLQQLANRLWDLGFRPQQGHGSVGQLAAVQNHLADLKEINQKLFSMLQEKHNENIPDNTSL